jgi:CRISPR-associated endoribonuclease Cas6
LIGSLVVGLETETDIRIKGLGGEALHGLVFGLLHKTAPDVASKLHQLEEQKPFSLSTFLEGHELKAGYSQIAGGKKATFKLSIFTKELLTTTINAFFTSLAEGEIHNLSGKPVTIATVNIGVMEANSITSFVKLLREASAETIINLEFLTPTCFKGNDIQTLFPEPKLVFSSLLRRWNAFSDTKLPEEYLGLLSSVKVSNYTLHTELINFSKYKMIGFRGRVEYRLPEETAEAFQQAMNALADFAFYAGVGAKTAMGMGQTRRIDFKDQSIRGVRNE